VVSNLVLYDIQFEYISIKFPRLHVALDTEDGN
jgi:hypothetical protein